MEHTHRPVRVFFYGTFMSASVLAGLGVRAGEPAAASVSGFDLVVGPRVNLARSDWGRAYGAIVAVTHGDLARLYGELERSYGVRYLPEAVLAHTLDGRHVPALCYVAHDMEGGVPDPAYVRQLASCIRELGLPEWYASRVEGFVPGPGETA